MPCGGLHCPGCSGNKVINIAEAIGLIILAIVGYEVYKWITSPVVIHSFDVFLEWAMITVLSVVGVGAITGITMGGIAISRRVLANRPQNEMLSATCEQVDHPAMVTTPEGIECVTTMEIDGVHTPMISTRHSLPVEAYDEILGETKKRFTLRRD